MKKELFTLLTIFGLFLLTLNISMATPTIGLYVDAAPNVYGSPDYDPWWNATKSDIVAGTFTNMANGVNSTNIGTTNFEIQDEVVYSFGDFGKRLTWTYWIPNETTASLAGRFEIKLENWWNGEYLDFYANYYGSSWLEPTKWENYDTDEDGTPDGVLGTAGMAWWGAKGVNTPEALAADILEWGKSDEIWKFSARLSDNVSSITSSRAGQAPVPEPATLLLFGAGLLALAGVNRKKNKVNI
ncbi:MAG: PEP-CTERM sorting domain-containing protein, partial [Candidatus Moranbacteria bacterium]|nr:PEP-CTERM sorting domain-containing protein [Candidatus Moranbacteria bacterium]